MTYHYYIINLKNENFSHIQKRVATEIQLVFIFNHIVYCAAIGSKKIRAYLIHNILIFEYYFCTWQYILKGIYNRHLFASKNVELDLPNKFQYSI